MNDDQPVKASNFNLKVTYPSAEVGDSLKKKRNNIMDSRMGVKDQMNNEAPLSREEHEDNSDASE